jgi:hypothetical protein
VNWREGFRRVTLALWLVGLAGWFIGYGLMHAKLHRPFTNICSEENVGRLYDHFDECLTSTKVLGGLYSREARDPSKVVRRMTTGIYWEALGILILGLAGWTGAAWGAFYGGAWIADGFRGAP